jgi:alkylmercury lyase-like protein
MKETGVDALQAADIPPERRGRARTARLSEAERDYYFWILREFAAGAPPTVEATRTAAARFGLDPDEAEVVLAREDLVHTDPEGRPLIAYPFSANARGHTVLIDGKQTVQAMCAIDALGIAPMLDQPIEIVSHDPISGAEVRVQLSAEGAATWQPAEAAVLAGSASCNGPSFCGCCDVLNFFEATANASQYLLEHPEVAGAPISIPEAIDAGRIVFGDVLEEH